MTYQYKCKGTCAGDDPTRHCKDSLDHECLVYRPTEVEAAIVVALKEHVTYDVEAYGISNVLGHKFVEKLSELGFEIVAKP